MLKIEAVAIQKTLEGILQQTSIEDLSIEIEKQKNTWVVTCARFYSSNWTDRLSISKIEEIDKISEYFEDELRDYYKDRYEPRGWLT